MSDTPKQQQTERVEEKDVISQSRQQDIAQARSRLPEVRLRAKQRANNPEYPDYGTKEAELEYRTAVEGYVLELLPFYHRNGLMPEIWKGTEDSQPLAVVRVGGLDPLTIADQLLGPSEKSTIYQNRYNVPPITETNFESGVIAVVPGLQDLLNEQKRYHASIELTFEPRNGAPFTRSTTISEVLTFSQLDTAMTWADRFAQEIELGVELGTPEKNAMDDEPF